MRGERGEDNSLKIGKIFTDYIIQPGPGCDPMPHCRTLPNPARSGSFRWFSKQKLAQSSQSQDNNYQVGIGKKTAKKVDFGVNLGSFRHCLPLTFYGIL